MQRYIIVLYCNYLIFNVCERVPFLNRYPAAYTCSPRIHQIFIICKWFEG